MPGFNLDTCARPNILALEPYRCARDDYKDDGTNILLDANENAFGPPIAPSLASTTSSSIPPNSTSTQPTVDLLGLHRYPDPHQEPLKSLLCTLRNTHHHTPKTLTPEHLFVGVGSDEAIDALIRCFCRPGRDRILVCPPTYGMYAVSAQVNDVSMVKVPLLPAPGFGVDVDAVLEALNIEEGVKMVYLCSPGNPTGAVLRKEDVQRVLEHPSWNGVVVLDEAYVDFAPEGTSLAEWVTEWPNLVVMQTLSKAFGMAGIRLGVAFASPPVARLLNAMKAPYNIANPTSQLAQYVLQGEALEAMRKNVQRLREQRERLVVELPKIKGVGRLRGGEASNFLLFEMCNAQGKPDNVTALKVYEGLAETKGVVVRFRGKEHGCFGCLRITVGTEQECTSLLAALEKSLAEVHAEEAVEDGAAGNGVAA